ncbi:MAG: porphobilinogen synthase [Opitutales bacterium]|jgi:porphobilinogen synthase
MSDKKDYQLDLVHRPRRLRQTQSLRDLVEETDLKVSKLIQPLFVIEGDSTREPVASMPGIERLSIDLLIKECESLIELGIGGVALFPKIDTALKCNMGREALNPSSLIYRAIKALRERFPELTIIADLALDPYTIDGHDGIVEIGSQSPLNDVTVDILAEMAVLAADAGATMVAPSDMMDGRVGVIRKTLDANAFESVLILSYAAKYASAFYGPFRDAVGSVSLEEGAKIDKRSYQLNPANRREALLETNLDELEGADILMVKPAGPYLDIIREVRDSTILPIAAYQVSGEYAQIMAASEKGWLDLKACRDESLLAIRRAGADMILTYFAKAYAQELN